MYLLGAPSERHKGGGWFGCRPVISRGCVISGNKSSDVELTVLQGASNLLHVFYRLVILIQERTLHCAHCTKLPMVTDWIHTFTELDDCVLKCIGVGRYPQ